MMNAQFHLLYTNMGTRATRGLTIRAGAGGSGGGVLPLLGSSPPWPSIDRPNELEGTDRADGYPPYNIEKTGGDNYRVTLAVAGFGREELEITQTENTLVVKGGTADDGAGGKFLHRGIAGRAFERRFQLADHIRVVAAELENGLLHVDLEREVPEELKPRTIEIGGDAKRIAKAA